MNPRETLTMSRKEAPRVGLLKALVAGRIRSREVAEALHVSDRQVRRLRRRFDAEGAEGLPHRSRGTRRLLELRTRHSVAAQTFLGCRWCREGSLRPLTDEGH